GLPDDPPHRVHRHESERTRYRRYEHDRDELDAPDPDEIPAEDDDHVAGDRRDDILDVGDDEHGRVDPEGREPFHPRDDIVKRLAHCSTRRQTAWAAAPSSRPTNPIASPVVAFTDTRPASTPSTSARPARIASMCGRSFGRCRTTVASTFPTA